MFEPLNFPCVHFIPLKPDLVPQLRAKEHIAGSSALEPASAMPHLVRKEVVDEDLQNQTLGKRL